MRFQAISKFEAFTGLQLLNRTYQAWVLTAQSCSYLDELTAELNLLTAASMVGLCDLELARSLLIHEINRVWFLTSQQAIIMNIVPPVHPLHGVRFPNIKL